LADIAKQEAKDQLLLQKLEELSQLFDKSLSSKNVDVQDVIPINTLDSVSSFSSSDLQTHLVVGFGLLLVSFIFINACRINNNSTLPSSNEDDFTSRIQKDADNYSKSCLSENFNSCDPALRGDVSSSLQDVAEAFTTAKTSFSSQITELNTKLGALDRSVNSQLGVRSLMLKEELIKVSDANENVSKCLTRVLVKLSDSFRLISVKLDNLNSKVDLSNTEAIALKAEIENLSLKRDNEIFALVSEIKSKLPELVAENPLSVSTFKEISGLCTSVLSYFS